jgi:hypothetical protein
MERVRIVKKALNIWEFDRSPNITTVPSFDYLFNLNGDILEANGDVSATVRLKSDNSIVASPTFDADGLVFDGTTKTYLRIGQQKNLSASWTIETRLKCTSGSGTQTFASGGPRPADGNQLFFFGGSPHTYIQISLSGGAKILNLPGSFDTTLFHIYKFVYDSVAHSLACYIDGSLINTFTSISPGTTLIQDFGSCSASTADFTGTIDYFQIKNSI